MPDSKGVSASAVTTGKSLLQSSQEYRRKCANGVMRQAGEKGTAHLQYILPENRHKKTTGAICSGVLLWTLFTRIFVGFLEITQFPVADFQLWVYIFGESFFCLTQMGGSLLPLLLTEAESPTA